MKRTYKPCRWTNVRCYLPTVILALALAPAIALLTWQIEGTRMDTVGPRQVARVMLLWFVLAPVSIGLLRGLPRTIRDLPKMVRRLHIL